MQSYVFFLSFEMEPFAKWNTPFQACTSPRIPLVRQGLLFTLSLSSVTKAVKSMFFKIPGIFQKLRKRRAKAKRIRSKERSSKSILTNQQLWRSGLLVEKVEPMKCIYPIYYTQRENSSICICLNYTLIKPVCDTQKENSSIGVGLF